jgi:hypothetical protein
MGERLYTVTDYIEAVRSVIQDTTVPYRYADDDILVGFNMTLLEARRLRADLFVSRWGNEVPHYDTNDGEPVPIEPQFRLGFVYGTAFYVMTFDAEDVQDQRANSFLGFFHDILTGVRPGPIQGGTPAAGQPQT